MFICFTVIKLLVDENKMPIKRKIVAFGNSSKGIILPKSWLDLLEEKNGKIESVSMEVNDTLVIRPILKEDIRNQTTKSK